MVHVSLNYYFKIIKLKFYRVFFGVYVSVCLLSITYATDKDSCIAVETFTGRLRPGYSSRV